MHTECTATHSWRINDTTPLSYRGTFTHVPHIYVSVTLDRGVHSDEGDASATTEHRNLNDRATVVYEPGSAPTFRFRCSVVMVIHVVTAQATVFAFATFHNAFPLLTTFLLISCSFIPQIGRRSTDFRSNSSELNEPFPMWK